MTFYARPSESCNPSEERIEKEKTETAVVGACVVCWGVIGFLVIVGSVAKLLGLF